MKLLEYALLKLAEESNEVAQMCSKCTQFTLDEITAGQTLRNSERLHTEIDDFLATLYVLNVLGLGYEPDPKAQAAKFQKMYKYLKVSEKLGTISKKDVELFKSKIIDKN